VPEEALPGAAARKVTFACVLGVGGAGRDHQGLTRGAELVPERRAPAGLPRISDGVHIFFVWHA